MSAETPPSLFPVSDPAIRKALAEGYHKLHPHKSATIGDTRYEWRMVASNDGKGYSVDHTGVVAMHFVCVGPINEPPELVVVLGIWTLPAEGYANEVLGAAILVKSYLDSETDDAEMIDENLSPEDSLRKYQHNYPALAGFEWEVVRV
jgi:hypothetical protein